MVGRRLGRTLLELGGNNAIIVTPTADLELAVRGTVFAAVGTAGQRCTTARRLIVHESIHDVLLDRLMHGLSTACGSATRGTTACSWARLINEAAVEAMMAALEAAKSQGGELVCGGRRLDRPGFFVEPAIVKARPDMPIVARGDVRPDPLCDDLPRRSTRRSPSRTASNRACPRRSSPSDLREAEQFLSPEGSDCGIANVNIGTSGAEIGGAFGGEKATGGGREAGSDAWKAYMRRQTCTINYGADLPLAQGVEFDIAGS